MIVSIFCPSHVETFNGHDPSHSPCVGYQHHCHANPLHVTPSWGVFWNCTVECVLLKFCLIASHVCTPAGSWTADLAAYVHPPTQTCCIKFMRTWLRLARYDSQWLFKVPYHPYNIFPPDIIHDNWIWPCSATHTITTVFWLYPSNSRRRW